VVNDKEVQEMSEPFENEVKVARLWRKMWDPNLTRLEPDADLNRGWENFILCHHVALSGVLPLIFVKGKIQSSGFA